MTHQQVFRELAFDALRAKYKLAKTQTETDEVLDEAEALVEAVLEQGAPCARPAFWDRWYGTK